MGYHLNRWNKRKSFSWGSSAIQEETESNGEPFKAQTSIRWDEIISEGLGDGLYGGCTYEVGQICLLYRWNNFFGYLLVRIKKIKVIGYSKFIGRPLIQILF